MREFFGDKKYGNTFVAKDQYWVDNNLIFGSSIAYIGKDKEVA